MYADDLQIYMLFPRSGDFDLIQIFLFNCITDLTEWFSHDSLSITMTKTDTIIFSRPGYLLSIIHPFLLSWNSSNLSIYNYNWFQYNLLPRLLSIH